MTMRHLALTTILILISSLSAKASIDWNHYNSAVGIIIQKFEFKTVCTGVLLAPRVVLTAAHCIEGLISASVNIDEEITDPEHSGTVKLKYRARSWVMHPKYDSLKKTGTDLGLIFLNTPVTKFINYPRFSNSMNLRPSDPLIRIGFGKRENKNIRTMIDEIFLRVTNSQIVATDQYGFGGDSGGPVFIDRQGQLFLIGTHSSRGTDSAGNLVDISFTQPLDLTWLDEVIL